MAKMFKCDLTGQAVEGAPLQQVTVALDADTKLGISVYKRTGPNAFSQGDLSPAAAELLAKALGGLSKSVGASK